MSGAYRFFLAYTAHAQRHGLFERISVSKDFAKSARNYPIKDEHFGSSFRNIIAGRVLVAK